MYSLSHRVEAVHIPTAPSFIVARLVPRTRRAAGAIVYNNACRELQVGHTQRSVLIGFITLVTQLGVSITVPTKSR